jgi:hypothetical protein
MNNELSAWQYMQIGIQLMASVDTVSSLNCSGACLQYVAPAMNEPALHVFVTLLYLYG